MLEGKIDTTRKYPKLEKFPTGIESLDRITFGGFPKGRTILLSGASGTGKTILSFQYLWEGIVRYKQPGVFVACEESLHKLMEDLSNLEYANSKVTGFIDNKMLKILDVSKMWITDISDESTEYGLGSMTKKIEEIIDETNAKRVVIDPGSVLIMQFNYPVAIRKALHKIAHSLEFKGCTSLFTVEETNSNGTNQFGNIEKFVLDGTIRLRYKPEDNLRYIEIEKMRGTQFVGGRHILLFTKNGIEIYPSIMPEFTMGAITDKKVSIGVRGIDNMLQGGVFKTDSTLVTGSTGTGKSIIGIQFLAEGIKNGKKSMFISFEESRGAIKRNARNIGIDFDKYEKEGNLILIPFTTHDLIPARYIECIKENIEKYKIERIVIDSLSSYSAAFESETDFKNHLISLLSIFKSHDVTSLLISEMHDLFGSFQITNSGTSFLVDNIIIMRYVEMESEITKAISVLKTRGSDHDRTIREFAVTSKGIEVSRKFEGKESVMNGNTRSIASKVEEFFKKE